jgi:hypothetical protein
MKLNRAERWTVNNLVRVITQSQMVGWMKGVGMTGSEPAVLAVDAAGIILKRFKPRTMSALDLVSQTAQQVRK